MRLPWRGGSPVPSQGIFESEAMKQKEIEDLIRTRRPTIVLIRQAREGIKVGKGRLGVFPASFNPPTLAHQFLVEEAQKEGHLDEILVLLDIRAVDKRPVEASFEDRLQMLNLVFRKHPKVSIGLSNRGLFLEKLEALRHWYPDGVELFFVVGFDTILRVLDGKYYSDRQEALDRLFKSSRFLVANRGSNDKQAFRALFRRRENRPYQKRVSFFTLPSELSTLSSSEVRESLRQGRPVRGVLPSVLRFIQRRDLYRGREGRSQE